MSRLNSKRNPNHSAAYLRERRSQVRGLLVVAGIVLLWVLYRADLGAVFHPGWWRL